MEVTGTDGGRLLKRWLVQGGRLALTVVVTWFILDRVGLGLDELAALDLGSLRPDPAWLIAASVLLLLMYFATAALWGRIVVDLGGPAIATPVAVRIFMIANLGRYVPGKVWQIAGLAALAKGRGVPATTATAAAVLGQGLALVAATAIGLGALLAGPPAQRRWGLVVAALMGAAVLAGSLPPVFRYVAGAWFRLTRTEAPEALGAVHGIRWLLVSLVIWAGYALSFWLLVTSFGSSAPLVPTASAFAAAYVLGYLMIFAPAGVGVREGFLVAFLTPSLGLTVATAMSVVARIWTTVVEVLPAAGFWLLHVRKEPAGE